MQFKTFFAQDEFGNVAPESTASVYVQGTTTLIELFDVNGNSIDNPVDANYAGKFEFAAADGQYDLFVDAVQTRIKIIGH